MLSGEIMHSQEMVHFPFLQLTAELRNRVYELVFPPGLIYRIYYRGSPPSFSAVDLGNDESRFVHWGHVCFMHPPNTHFLNGMGMGLLRACRQLYDECIEIAYQNPIFAIMNIFRAPVGCALPFLRSLGNPALQNLRYLSLNVGELDHDDYPVTSADALEFRGSKAAALEQLLSQSHLRCLYLAVEYSLGAKGDGASITYPRWKWVCAFIKRNQSNKLVDEVHVDFLVHEPPSQSFIGRLTSAAKSWHDLPSVLEYKHWRLEGSKDQGSGENIDNFDYNQPLLLYKNVRESPNGTKTHLNIYKFMNSYDWDSDDDTFADWDLHRDSEDDWI